MSAAVFTPSYIPPAPAGFFFGCPVASAIRGGTQWHTPTVDADKRTVWAICRHCGKDMAGDYGVAYGKNGAAASWQMQDDSEMIEWRRQFDVAPMDVD